LWDYDRLNAHDLIGVCAIPFRDIIAEIKANKPFHFNRSVFADGANNGTFSGTIRLNGVLPGDIRLKMNDTSRSENVVSLSELEAIPPVPCMPAQCLPGQGCSIC
jgi:hypothetical protein